jgi:hypothetical protein
MDISLKTFTATVDNPIDAEIADMTVRKISLFFGRY